MIIKEVKLDVTPALATLQNTAAKLGNLSPVHRAIGELLVLSTKERFAQSTAPDGSTWKALAESTMSAYISTFGKSNFKKDGKLNKRGDTRVANRKPLIGESRSLSTQIFYEVSASGNELTIGSPMEYAAAQQFGSKAHVIKAKNKKALFGPGMAHPVKQVNHPGIDARPFIGLSAEDVAMMERQYADYIGNFAQRA